MCRGPSLLLRYVEIVREKSDAKTEKEKVKKMGNARVKLHVALGLHHLPHIYSL